MHFIIGKILIITGNPYYNGISSEVIDMNNENINCQDLIYAPYQIVGGTGGLVKGRALICGGYENGVGDSNKCWILGKSKIIPMAYERVASSSIVIQDKVSSMSNREGFQNLFFKSMTQNEL